MRGRLTTLRLPTEADLPAFARWSADMRVRAALAGAYWGEPATLDTWKERLAKQSEAKSSILWAIEAGGAAVGSCRLEFSTEPQRIGLGFEIGHFTIDPEHWRRGLGWDSALTLHRWIFDIADGPSAGVDIAAHNAAALRIAERLGHREFARGTAALYGDGRRVDRVKLVMRREDWDERWGATEREYPVPLGEELER